MILALAQEGDALAGPASDPLWWLWLLVAVAFIVAIAWLVQRLGPGGPWFR